MTPLPHAPGARMVVITKTSSHEPARQPASQASQLAIPPPSQPPASRPASQPASQPATASQPASGGRRCEGRSNGPFQGCRISCRICGRSNFGQNRHFFLQTPASFLFSTRRVDMLSAATAWGTRQARQAATFKHITRCCPAPGLRDDAAAVLALSPAAAGTRQRRTGRKKRKLRSGGW